MTAKKTTHRPSGAELLAYRREVLKLTRAAASGLTGIPVRTLEDTEAGRRRAGARRIMTAYRRLHRQMEQSTRRIVADLQQDIERRFPMGIASEGAAE